MSDLFGFLCPVRGWECYFGVVNMGLKVGPGPLVIVVAHDWWGSVWSVSSVMSRYRFAMFLAVSDSFIAHRGFNIAERCPYIVGGFSVCGECFCGFMAVGLLHGIMELAFYGVRWSGSMGDFDFFCSEL